MNDLYPIFVKLRGRFCLVVGGGEIAAWKIRAVREAGGAVTVVSPEAVAEIVELAESDLVRWVRREYRESDLEGHFLAIAATDDSRVSRRVFEDCERRGMLCNAVDQDDFCSFHVPAVSRRGDIKVAISTAGKSPAFAAKLKRRVQDSITEADARFVAKLGEMRPRILEEYADDPGRRKEFFQHLVECFERKRHERAGSPRNVERALEGAVGGAVKGTVYLVGAGPGSAGLLTMRGAKLLDDADVVFYDRLVGPAILAAIPDRLEKIYVGKEAGRDDRPDTGDLLVNAARAGRAVVRLKGGDPNLFGRGGEEMLALIRAGVPFEVVPGVSALTAVPAANEIPLTFRDISQQVIVRTGYRRPDTMSPKLTPPGSRETTFVYFMAVGRLTEIVDELRTRDELPAGTPIAVIQRGTLPDQAILRGTLGDILDLATRTPMRPPALVVAGEVVRFAAARDLLDGLAGAAGEAEVERFLGRFRQPGHGGAT